MSGSNHSNHSREALKNVSNVKEGSRGEKFGSLFEENYGNQIQIDNQAENRKNVKANRIPKRNKPPRLPNNATVANSLNTTGTKAKLDGEEGQESAGEDLEKADDSAMHHSTSQVKRERERPGFVSSTPRERAIRARSNQMAHALGWP